MVASAHKIQEILTLYEIGTEVRVVNQEELSTEVLKERKYDALLFGYIIDLPEDVEAFWHSKERESPGLNISLYTRKEADTLIEKLSIFETKEERLKNISEIEIILKKDFALVPLFRPSYILGTYTRIKNIQLPEKIITSADRYRNKDQWYIYTNTVSNLIPFK
jgi:ABC-type oligopeptide transport system substrate-binding subunit